MYSAKVWSNDPLYTSLNTFLAHAAPHKIVISSRSDYRDPAYMKVSLDYGSFMIELKEHGVKCKVDHLPPTEDTHASLTFQADTYEQNIAIMDLAIRSYVKSPDQRVVGVYSWEGGWHQRQAVYVTEHKLSKSQQFAMEAIDWFYKNPKHFYENSLPYQRGIVLSGPSATGKHWIVRHAALEHQKSMCYLPVTEATFASIGPAIACAPLNSIVMLDGLVQFYQHIPSGERCVFLRHMESVFNTSVCDPRGLLIVLVSPVSMPPELERFLLMPHRFQKKIEMSLSSTEPMLGVLRKHLSVPDAEVERLVRKAAEAQLSVHIVNWFFAEQRMDVTQPSNLVVMLEELIQRVKDERKAIDGALPGQAHRERMYS